MLVIVRRVVGMGVGFVTVVVGMRLVLMLMEVAFPVGMFMFMPVGMFMGMGFAAAMGALFAVFPVGMRVFMGVLLSSVRFMGVGGPFVDAEFHPFDGVAFLPFEVHVKIANLQLGEFPFKGGWLDAEVTKSADGHVAADA
jgi:hypothetical protein